MIRCKLSQKLGEKRWTQAMLARVADIRPNTISKLYNEMAERVSFEHLDRICKALECDLTDILQYVPDEVGKSK